MTEPEARKLLDAVMDAARNAMRPFCDEHEELRWMMHLKLDGTVYASTVGNIEDLAGFAASAAELSEIDKHKAHHTPPHGKISGIGWTP